MDDTAAGNTLVSIAILISVMVAMLIVFAYYLGKYAGFLDALQETENQRARLRNGNCDVRPGDDA